MGARLRAWARTPLPEAEGQRRKVVGSLIAAMFVAGALLITFLPRTGEGDATAPPSAGLPPPPPPQETPADTPAPPAARAAATAFLDGYLAYAYRGTPARRIAAVAPRLERRLAREVETGAYRIPLTAERDAGKVRVGAIRHQLTGAGTVTATAQIKSPTGYYDLELVLRERGPEWLVTEIAK